MKPFQLIFFYARKYKLPLFLTSLSMLLLVGAQLVIPLIVRNLIAAITAVPPSTEVLPFISQLSLLAFLIYLFRAGLQFVRSYMAHVAGWGVVADVRKHIYEHMQRLSLRFYEDKQTGQLMSRIINDTELFEQFISHALPDVLVNAITLIGVSVVLFSINWQLALLSLAPIPLVVWSLRIYARRVRPAFRARQVELGNLNATLNDSLSGIREIKAFTREEDQLTQVGMRVDNFLRSNLTALRLMAVFQPFVEFTSSLGLLIVIYFGGRLVLSQELPVADLVAYFLYLELFYQPVRVLSNAWEQIQGSLAGADRVADLLAERPETRRSADTVDLPGRADGGLAFKDVCFEYQPGHPVLEGITLDIPARSITALVGPTGVGKTTLVSLIPRFYDVTSGRITLDGHDLRQLSLDSLRRQVSIVLQDVFLFHGTVRENILFGRHDASDEAVIAAAKAANAHAFISDLSEGYDTLIGERGVKLSGGQKQRLAIARAVLKDAPILILDEATSSVDTETEMLIQQALERLMAGRTTILIAHRLSTVCKADQIVVLEGKQIVEIGKHEQLIAQEGLYHRLYTVQEQLEPVQQTLRQIQA